MSAILPPMGQDPSEEQVPCNICGTLVPIGQSHSFVASVVPDNDATHPGWQCIDGKGGHMGEVDWSQSHTFQHFACSQEHAIAATKTCLEQHIAPSLPPNQGFHIAVSYATTGQMVNNHVIHGFCCTDRTHHCPTIDHISLHGGACIDEHLVPLHQQKALFLQDTTPALEILKG